MPMSWGGFVKLCKGINKILPMFLYFHPIWIKFKTDVHKNLESNCEFVKTVTASHTLVRDINQLPCFPHLLSDLSEIQYQRSAHNLQT